MSLSNETDTTTTTKPRLVRKKEIIDLATRMFAERGYQGTSMGDLAEGVGLRKASLFHHFESKDRLYSEVIAQLLTAVEGGVADALATEGSFLARLDAMTMGIIAVFASHPYSARLFLREAMDWGPVMQADLAGRAQGILRQATDFIRAGQQAGAFTADVDAQQLVLSIVGMHFIPFVIDRTTAELVGGSPFTEKFVQERQRSMREQIHRLVTT